MRTGSHSRDWGSISSECPAPSSGIELGIEGSLREAFADGKRNHVVRGAMDNALRYGNREQLDGRRGSVPFGNLVRRSAQKLSDDSPAELQRPGEAQVGNRGERNHASQRKGVLRGEPERELASGRVPGRNDARQIQRVHVGQGVEVRGGFPDIVQRPGVTAARLAETPVFETPDREARTGERGAKRARMRQIECLTPETSVDEDHDRMRAGRFGEL